MGPQLYRELVPWYRLLDPPADHLDEATSYRVALQRLATPAPVTLLELGAGAGHNALHLKPYFRCTLTDPSPEMQGLSRELNPECEHLPGDMRTLRLGREFDAVLVHDAVCYMTTVEDLAAAVATAFVHTRPGGAAVFAPDFTRETFHEETELFEEDSADGARALRCLCWAWDPDPDDTVVLVDYAFLLRAGRELRAVHDRHVEGIFPHATWLGLLRGAGYEVETIARPLDDGRHDEVFACRRPG